MSFRGMKDFRDRRNQFHNMPYQMHYSIASYCTDSSKGDMKATFGDELLNNLPLIPDPLRKNLADTLLTADVSTKVDLEENLHPDITMNHPKVETNTVPSDSHKFTAITNFISGVFNVLSGAMFRSKPEDQQYNFNYINDRQRSPDDWQSPKIVDQNKNERAHEHNGEKEIKKTMEINNDYLATVTSCEDKLNQVRTLLNTKTVKSERKYHPRRPKKQFVDLGAYEEVFEEAFTPEDITNLPNDPLVKSTCPSTYHSSECLTIDGPLLRIHNGPQKETTSQEAENQSEINLDTKNIKTEANNEKKCILISSCEEKMKKLKALLPQNKIREPSTDLAIDVENKMPVTEHKHIQKPISSKIHDKHYKNHHRTTNKRQKNILHRDIQEDLIFADEIDPDSWSNVENSPTIMSDIDNTPSDHDYFDEIKGRFRNSSTTESDDSFQIVFKEPQTRKVSECGSEDSFIIFDDSPESCYVSTDVFGDQSGDTDYSDSDESDSGCATNLRCNKLSPYLSRTLSDLTDDTLYEPVRDIDQVDCCFKSVVELPIKLEEREVDKKKFKKVHFSPLPPKVHVMRVWAFAARQARAGHWERHTLDRERFKRRIADVEMAISWVLKPQHRSRVIFQRFMPWWNAQRRKEIAEKRLEEIKRQEEEAIKKEHQREAEEKLVKEENQQDGMGQMSSELGQMSIELGQISSELGLTSTELGQISSELGQMSSENVNEKLKDLANQTDINNVNINVHHTIETVVSVDKNMNALNNNETISILIDDVQDNNIECLDESYSNDENANDAIEIGR